ncbi:MAG: uracil-DNA glycosylase [Ruminococcaceae bacterium]|jgi:DNA polymerase|nr:uracil-DNA glycosylase [Oscillospiraceae bacterium]
MNEKLAVLKNECLKCEACPLSKTRTNVVFGDGNENAKIVFIGEAPGANEDLQGVPFVGRSGKLLDEMCESVGLSRKTNIYIANTVKCRPPENRDPSLDEQRLCAHWLKSQLEIMRPRIIVCVGRIAAQEVIGKNFSISRQHGEFFRHGKMILTAVYHPAAILRNINLKPDTVEDLKKIKLLYDKITSE